ncbi:MAG: adenylate/guanylate cyclase domain-containing protein [Acidimicrobiia bacterium]
MGTPVVVVRPPNRQPLVLLLEDRVEVGRECDGLIVPDSRMSRRHLALEPLPDGSVRVTDLGSSNGTLVDRTAITDAVIVPPGGLITAGDTEFEVGRVAGSDRLLTETSAPIPAPFSAPTSIESMASEVSQDLRPERVGVHDEPGTLTVVFTDIEKSTDLAVSLGDAVWFGVLREHQQVVGAQAEKNAGRIVQSLGDGFMLCFRSARQALLFSIGLQHDLERQHVETPEFAVRVRVGLHTGEVLVDDGGDLIGRHVVVAARIADLADGGEVLASSLVKQIAEPRGDVAFVDPREVVLKGIGDVETVYRVDWRAFAP